MCSLYNLMEDAATAEISRAQLWQWLHHKAKMVNGKFLDASSFPALFARALVQIEDEAGINRKLNENYFTAIEIFRKFCLDNQLADFLTLEAYKKID